jgi:aminopeptidase-like protein|tara:strand:- start:815 stop:2125 length:1311 start_codon:yes stop_codon:yes gene_type:complete
MFNLEKFFDQLFPIYRSITGDGYRQSFNLIKKFIPFKKYKYQSGKKVFDWELPKEWNIKEAYVKNLRGGKIIDFNRNNLHLMSYSTPVKKVMPLSELNKNLHSITHLPKYIPYVTSYYKKNWGFCLTHNQRLKLRNENYKVLINSSLKKGFIEWGEHLLKKTVKDNSLKKDTILITSYLCHPSMANNELSGPLIQILIYLKLKKLKKRKFNYLFVTNPETIGSICFIHKNLKFLKEKLLSGLVLTCLGGPEKKLSYKFSREGNSLFDKYFTKLAKNKKIKIRKFNTNGSDERQYCSSECNLPVGQLARTVYGKNKEYHTSADNKKFVRLKKFKKTANEIFNYIQDNEKQIFLRRKQPYCEIQLGKRDFYPNTNSPNTWKDSSDKILNSKQQLDIISKILSDADGLTALSGVAFDKKYTYKNIKNMYIKLKKRGLLY